VLQGANTGTRDIDIWFEDVSDPRIGEAVAEAEGIWVSRSFGMRPPQIGGDALGDRVDVVTHVHGLGTFEDELANTFRANRQRPKTDTVQFSALEFGRSGLTG
jgi:hypothetical protein